MFIVFLISAVVAGQINHAIYRLSWTPRSLSPWWLGQEKVPSRTWKDRIPVIGWWFLQRESSIHGPGFWIRPMLLEISFILAMLFLYVYELNQGLLPTGGALPQSTLTLQFASHFVLISLMLAATFIDIDEKYIPDAITIPGTLLGFAIASAWPESLLPSWTRVFGAGPVLVQVFPCWLTQPNVWPAILDGWQGLVIALLGLGGWIFALLPKRYWPRCGVTKFIPYFFASIKRRRESHLLLGLLTILLAVTTGIWSLGGDAWKGLLSSIVGMVAGGGIVWSIRIVASPILGQEAMGFGDVTLMGMIGAFIGWQASLAAFFVSPFTGCVVAILQWILTRSNRIAFGPFLCSGALIVILCWRSIWETYGPFVFRMGILIPIFILLGLVMLAVMLFVWLGIKNVFLRLSESTT